jgi:hypothetical protein
MRVGKYKVDLGSYIFVPTDTHASLTGPIKMGNDEYVEYVEFNIVDPFYLMYSDDWKTFREDICGETRGTNVGGTGLNISLNIISEYDNRYMLNEEYVGCATSFPISRKEDGDYLDLALNFSKDPLGFVFETNVNKAYEGDTFMKYLFETYNIGLLNDNEKPTQPIQNDQLRFQLIIKNSDTAIVGPTITGGGDMKYSTLDTNGKFTKEILWSDLPDEGESSLFKKFFDNWEAFDEGWAIVGSLTIVDNTEDENEILYIVSNTIPITQEIFAMYTNGGTEYIEEVLTEEFKANIPKYNIVNKSQVIVDTLAKPVKIIDKNSTDIEKILFKFNALKKFEKLKYVTKPMLKIGK